MRFLIQAFSVAVVTLCIGLFRKRRRRSFGPLYVYTEEEAEQFENYVEEQFGHFDEVIHEIISPDIRLDIIVVPPTEDDNYYKLITMGMGAYKMHVPSELKCSGLERAELVLYLPPEWNIKSAEEKDYWPIRQLKILARLPITCKTWLGFGHTVSSDAENTPYSDNTELCSMLLLDAVGKDCRKLDFSMPTTGKINFYQAVPLYKEELDFKMEHDADALLDLFDDDGLPVVLDINWKNYCAKR